MNYIEADPIEAQPKVEQLPEDGFQSLRKYLGKLRATGSSAVSGLWFHANTTLRQSRDFLCKLLHDAME